MLAHQVDHHVRDLQVAVNHVIGVKVFIVFAIWVQQGLGNFEPTNVEEELQYREKWENIIDIGLLVTFDISFRIQPLTPYFYKNASILL